MKNSAANSFANAQSMSNNGTAGVQINTFNSNPSSDPLSHDSDTKALRMSTRLNQYENELHKSPSIRELWEKEELQKRKAHTTYDTTVATKVAFGVFSLFSIASSVTIPKHQKNPNATYTEHVMNYFMK